LEVLNGIHGEARIARLVARREVDLSLDKVLASVRLHTISDIKGLEFERVILYKIGSRPIFSEFAEQTIRDTEPEDGLRSRMPVLYHLNRLYIAVTRSTKYLFVFDEAEAVQKIWARMKEVDCTHRDNIRGLSGDPALAAEDDRNWVADARKYLDLYREERDARMLAYALDCLDRAPHHLEAQHLLLEVRAEQLEDEAGTAYRKGEGTRAQIAWKQAGDNWSQFGGVFRMKAAQAYVHGEQWSEVRRTLSLSSSRSLEHEGWLLYSDLMCSEGRTAKAAATAYLKFLIQSPDVPTIDGSKGRLSEHLQELRLIDDLVELHETVLWKTARDDVAPMVKLCDFLLKEGKHDIVVRVIERNRLQRLLGRQYVAARTVLAEGATKASNWEEAGKQWKALADSGAGQDQAPSQYRRAADAFAEAALIGASQLWSEAAQSYLKSTDMGSPNVEIAQAEDSARLGNFSPAIKGLSGAMPRLQLAVGPLRRDYTSSYAWSRLKTWTDQLDPLVYARDPNMLSAVVALRLHDGERPATKELLARVIGTRDARGKELALQRLASLELEDQNFKGAIECLERAEDLSRAWQLAEEHQAQLDPTFVKGVEGRFLGYQYVSGAQPDRGTVDRAIALLEEAGVFGDADRLKRLRTENERDVREKVRLILAEGEGIELFVQAVSAVNATGNDSRAAEAKLQLMHHLVSNPTFIEHLSEKLRPALVGWMRDVTFVIPAQAEFSERGWGFLVECCQDDLSAKSYYQVRSGTQEWAREGFRRVLGRMRHEFRLQARTDTSKNEYVGALERELAEFEKKWSEGAVISPKRSPVELTLMKQKLAGETIPQLRERWKEAGIPGSRAATKEVLVEGFLEYWAGEE
ncbi:MAG: hypothetical protein WB789_08195, partial [Thermoplasmata archaeon]